MLKERQLIRLIWLLLGSDPPEAIDKAPSFFDVVAIYRVTDHDLQIASQGQCNT